MADNGSNVELRREIAWSEDFLFQDALLPTSSWDSSYSYVKRDFLFRPGVWRGKHTRPPAFGSESVIVVGHSDLPLTSSDVFKMARMGFQGDVYASNLNSGFGLNRGIRAFPLPLGLSNPTTESLKHKVFGDISSLKRVILEPAEEFKPARLFANFDVKTSPRHRRLVWRECVASPRITVRVPEVTLEARLQYLREMRDFGAVVCPRGNGLDTHRFYEALYVGAVPVVLRGSYMARLGRYYGFPLIEVPSWSALRQDEKIGLLADDLRRAPAGLGVLRKSYWNNLLSAR